MKIMVMKCQAVECGKPATWKAGTWWVCDVHVKEYGISAKGFDEGLGYTTFGSSYRLLEPATLEELSQNYFVGKVPINMFVEIEVLDK